MGLFDRLIGNNRTSNLKKDQEDEARLRATQQQARQQVLSNQITPTQARGAVLNAASTAGINSRDVLRTGNAGSFGLGATSAIAKYASPQSLIGSAASYGGKVMNNKGLENFGERTVAPIRKFGTDTYDNAGNKAANTAGNIAGSVFAGWLNPGKAGSRLATGFNVGRYGLVGAADTAESIKQAGGSRTAQVLGGGASGAVQGGLAAFSTNQALGRSPKTGALFNTAGKRIFTSGVTNALENTSQQLGENVIAQKSYDPNRKLTEGLLPAAGTGFVMGSGMAGTHESMSPAGRQAIKAGTSKVVETNKELAGIGKQNKAQPKEDLNLLRDYVDMQTKGYNPQGAERNLIIRDARSVAKNAGIDITSGSPQEVGKRVYDYIKKQGRIDKNRGGFVKIPGKSKDPAPELHSKQKEMINDYAEMLEDMGSGNGVDITPDGRRISSNYRPGLEGKSMTKQNWFDEARKQIESGKAGYGVSDDYKLLPTLSKTTNTPRQISVTKTPVPLEAGVVPSTNQRIGKTSKNSVSVKLSNKEVLNGFHDVRKMFSSDEDFYENFILKEADKPTRSADLATEIIGRVENENIPLKEAIDGSIYSDVQGNPLLDNYHSARSELTGIASRNKQPQLIKQFNEISKGKSVEEKTQILKGSLNQYRMKGGFAAEMFGAKSPQSNNVVDPMQAIHDNNPFVVTKETRPSNPSTPVMQKGITLKDGKMVAGERLAPSPQDYVRNIPDPVKPNPVPTDVTAKSFAEGKPDFMDTTNRHLGEISASKTRNVQAVKDMPKLDKNASLDLIDRVQSGDTKNVPEQLRPILENKYKELKDNGIDIGYVEDYFPQKWADEAKVKQEYQSIQLKAGIQIPREIPTYKEGIVLGYTPKNADYRSATLEYLNTADKLIADRKYFSELKNKGLIAEAGSRPQGMQVVDAPGLPQPRPFIDPETGNQVQGNYYAKPDVARRLNQLYGEQGTNKILNTTGKISGGIQSVFLSGGLPGTPLNAFGSAQWMKQALAGNPISSTKSFFRSFSGAKTDKFFSDNNKYVNLMQKEGVSFRSSLDAESLKSISDRVAEKTNLPAKAKTGVQEAFNSVMADPTFKRFLPAMQIDTYKKSFTKAVKSGKTEAEAAKIAGDTTRNVFGMNSMAKDALKNKDVSNLNSTLFFAPKFRESMINFWINNAKSLKHPTDPAYRDNLKFLASSTVLFGLMQAANMALNEGKTTFQNDNPYDKLNLSIPKGDGSSLAIPFLSSVATVPRNVIDIGISAATGNPKEAGMKAKSFLSMGLRPFVDLATNQKFNGRTIYNDKDKTGERVKDQAAYLAGQFNQPYVRAAIDVATGKSSGGLETAATAFEAPLRFRDAYTPKGNSKQAADTKDSIMAGFTTPEAKKFAALSEEDKKFYQNEPQYAGLYKQYNAMKKAFTPGDTYESSLDPEAGKVLDTFSRLTNKGKEGYLKNHPTAEFDLEYSKYLKDVSEGNLSRAQDIKRNDELNKLKIGVKYSKDSRDISTLSKDRVSALVRSDKNGKKIAEDLLAYNDELLAQGLTSNHPYRDKYGNPDFYPVGGKSKGGKGRAPSFAGLGLIAKSPINLIAKAPSVKKATMKRGQFKKKA